MEGLLLERADRSVCGCRCSPNRPSRPTSTRIDRFYTDAADGKLPQFSFVEPDYGTSSEENPQDIQFGDQFLAGIVNAVMSGPAVVQDPC